MKRKVAAAKREAFRALVEAAQAKGFSGSAPWLRRDAERGVELLWVGRAGGADFTPYLMVARHPAPARAEDAALLGSTRIFDGRLEASDAGSWATAVGAMLAWSRRTTRGWPSLDAPLAMDARSVVQRLADAVAKDLHLPRLAIVSARVVGPLLRIAVKGKRRASVAVRASAIHSLIAALHGGHPKIEDIVYGIDRSGNNRVETALLSGALEAACEDLASLLAEHGAKGKAEAGLCLIRAGIAEDKVASPLGRRLFAKRPKALRLLDQASSDCALVARATKHLALAQRSSAERIMAAAALVMMVSEAWWHATGARKTRLVRDLNDAIARLAKDREPAARDLGKVLANLVAMLQRRRP